MRQQNEKRMNCGVYLNSCLWLALVLSSALLSNAAYAQPLGQKLDAHNTYAVVVGVLRWEQESLTTYSPENRQDVALYQKLEKIGVPAENMALLLDDAATREAIGLELKRIAALAKPGSTLIVYYAGHGLVKDSEGIFACYDIHTNALPQSGWRHHELTNTLREHFRGGQVLLFADCCFSGALGNVALALSQHGIAAASLTSASSSNTSTNNWTYTNSLIELLDGLPLADANRDGVVTLSEAAYDVRQAMLYHEQQRNGFSVKNVPPDFQLSTVRTNETMYTWSGSSDQLNLTQGDYVSANDGNGWRPARMVAANGKRIMVQYQGYSGRSFRWVTTDDIRTAPAVELKLVPPEPLADDIALAKASFDGKYRSLLKKIEVETDFTKYGAHYEWGKWTGTSYATHDSLPTGYWVYVYPHWYIWEKLVVAEELKPLARETLDIDDIAP